MSSRRLRFGIVGCGRIAPRHAESIASLHEQAKLVAVADAIPSRAHHLAQRYGAEVETDYRRLLDRKDIDVVNICTPSGLHAQMGIEAAQAGKHVIVEKPIALTLQDADSLICACANAGVTLTVVLQNRYNPPMQDLKHLVESGKLGRLLLGNATVRWYRPQSYYEDGWHGTRAMDGGALMNQSIHHIDALQWVMGDVERVFAYGATLAHRMECEDAGVAVLRFVSGALGVVEGSTITWPENLEGSVAIFGERGSVKVGGTALNRKVFWKVEGELEQERFLVSKDDVDPPTVYGYSHRAVIADAISAIADGRAPKTDGYEGRKSLKLVLAMYRSMETGREVCLSELESSLL
ncbi:MAG: Gfo/Idh/MocA family oxidoreductase [Anaerolineae bacterium]|nr:Gfo/Idh/MocA family oxidoreductase [Thermoflexales bacterium]MDW8396021.1 Gfo/Idh/MocA family oxidoreductase [Anaerolineae bacterium]